MAAKLALQYDRQADILYLTSRPSYPEQETEERWVTTSSCASIPRPAMSRVSRSCSFPNACSRIPWNFPSPPIFDALAKRWLTGSAVAANGALGISNARHHLFYQDLAPMTERSRKRAPCWPCRPARTMPTISSVGSS